MLKIEVIKFEAQDVITASTAAPCNHSTFVKTEGETVIDDIPCWIGKCGKCGIPLYMAIPEDQLPR